MPQGHSGRRLASGAAGVSTRWCVHLRASPIQFLTDEEHMAFFRTLPPHSNDLFASWMVKVCLVLAPDVILFLNPRTGLDIALNVFRYSYSIFSFAPPHPRK